jgi:S-formylglutathione hydrolase FrmB
VNPLAERALPVVAAALLLAGCGGGESGTTSTDRAPATPSAQTLVSRYSIDSGFTHAPRRQIAIRPPGVRRPPLLVFLHGRATTPDTIVDGGLAAAVRRLGPRAPAVVLPDGGDHSYYHDRRDGQWGTYVMREVIPAAVRRLHADPDRIAIGGISMGGFGAYDLALHHPRRFCAVGGHSPAIWTSAAQAAPGAFDDAADFARNDVVAMARRRRPAPRLWLDAGDGDPFLPGDRALAAALRVPLRVSPGGHEDAYWRAHYDEYARFYADALGRC